MVRIHEHNPEHSLGSLFGDYYTLWAEVEKLNKRLKSLLTDRRSYIFCAMDKVTVGQSIGLGTYVEGSVTYLDSGQAKRDVTALIYICAVIKISYFDGLLNMICTVNCS